VARSAKFEEQWIDRIGVGHRRYRVRVRPLPLQTWNLRPRNYEFEPCLVFWGGLQVPDDGSEDGISYWTVWFAFRESPYLHLELEAHDGEAIFVVEEHAPHHVMVPGYKFQPVVDGRTPVAEVEVLGIVNATEPSAPPARSSRIV
jgi:hypothetical protein